MADRQPNAAAPESSPAAAPEQRVRELVHDLRHCLFTLRTGIQLLRQSEHDAAQFEEILASMDNDQQRAAELLDEFLDLARGRGAP